MEYMREKYEEIDPTLNGLFDSNDISLLNISIGQNWISKKVKDNINFAPPKK